VADAIDQYGVNAVLCVYGWLLIIFVVLLFMRLFNPMFGGTVEQSNRLSGCWNENQLTGYQYWIFTQGQTTLRYRAGVIDQGDIECDLL